MKTGREKLIALSVMLNGDWRVIYDYIVQRKYLDENVMNMSLSMNYDCLTLIDEEYPEVIKNKHQPPFVIYYEGNIELLTKSEWAHIGILNDTLASNYAVDSTIKIAKDLINERVFVIPYSSKKNGEIIKKIIKNGGKAIVILDKGIGSVNCDDSELYEELKTNHLILSTYPQNVARKDTNTQITAVNLLSSICNEILVGGVSDRTPQSTAIGFGLAGGSTIFCIPFPMGSNYMNNQLIREGAVLVESGNDILEER